MYKQTDEQREGGKYWMSEGVRNYINWLSAVPSERKLRSDLEDVCYRSIADEIFTDYMEDGKFDVAITDSDRWVSGEEVTKMSDEVLDEMADEIREALKGKPKATLRSTNYSLEEYEEMLRREGKCYI